MKLDVGSARDAERGFVTVQSSPKRHSRSFLEDLAIDFGPVDLLGRFFLLADTAARERGITLSFGTLDELIAANRENSKSWKPIVSIFDPDIGGIREDNSFVVLGRDRSGEIVATQAARLFTWTATSFADEARSMRLFYPYPEAQRLPNEHIVVTAPSASMVRGRVAYSGGVWIRPDYRGRFLTGILPRISRANSFTRWYTDVTTTLMSSKLVEKGLADRCGYRQIDWHVDLKNTALGDLHCALLHMQTDEMLDDLSRFVEQIETKVDRRIENRAG